MPLSPEQEWTLVACGLIAHADGILEVGEWDQVLFMLEERLEDEEAAQWTGRLADREQLQQRLTELDPPPPLFSESILEKAWRMALADGEGSPTEAKVHDDLAERLGVDAGQAARLREGWTAAAGDRAELVAGFAAILCHLDGRTDPEERLRYEELLGRLPVAPDRREALLAKLDAPPELSQIVGGLASMQPEDRGVALLALVPVVRATGGAKEREAFVSLAESVAVSRDEAQRMLDR